jgi:hypothetical protein
LSLNPRFTVLYPFPDSRMLLERSCFSLMVCRAISLAADVGVSTAIGAANHHAGKRR